MHNITSQHSGESPAVDDSPDCFQVKPLASIISAMPLPDWRGDLTTLNGFTGTRPVLELDNASWDEIRQILVPENPAVLADKSKCVYVVPCLLNDAPLVGNTRDAAKRNGQPQNGKMRSKQHVTVARLLIIDVDGLPYTVLVVVFDKLNRDDLTYLAYTTHSHGSAEKPGMRVRLVILLDRPVDVAEYAAAWHGADYRYLNGDAGRADPSGARMYQQQGTWCAHPSRIHLASSWSNRGGIASADALIAIGMVAMAARSRTATQATLEITPPVCARKAAKENGYSTIDRNIRGNYPTSDANRVADACNQIGVFRETRGEYQSEPLWHDCLGVVGFCQDGEDFCHQWSSGHHGYDVRQTDEKLAYRLKIAPTTCAQFMITNPDGCDGCKRKCHSPITLGWKDEFDVVETTVVKL